MTWGGVAMVDSLLGTRAAAIVVSLVAMVVLPADPGVAGEKRDADLDCLALNIYFEARSEPLIGKHAVGHVVINRVEDSQFPPSVCQVVRQGGEVARHRCQFSWWCDGRSDKPVDWAAWRDSRKVAWEVLSGAAKDPTRGALWYHAIDAQPEWQAELVKDRQIGGHIFYHRP